MLFIHNNFPEPINRSRSIVPTSPPYFLPQIDVDIDNPIYQVVPTSPPTSPTFSSEWNISNLASQNSEMGWDQLVSVNNSSNREILQQPKLQSSYWFLFVSSLDRAKDEALLKEILFWSAIYHIEDSVVRIFHPAGNKRDYHFYRRVFEITEVPCLILADTDYHPNDFVRLSSGFLSEEILGQNYSKFREIMEALHNTLILEGDLEKIKSQLLQEKITNIVSKGWQEIKSLVSISLPNPGGS